MYDLRYICIQFRVARKKLHLHFMFEIKNISGKNKQKCSRYNLAEQPTKNQNNRLNEHKRKEWMDTENNTLTSE